MRKFATGAFFLLLLCVPLLAQGMSGDDLLDAVQVWRREVKRAQEHLRFEQDDDRLYEAADLFPEDGAETQPLIEQIRDDRTRGIVTVTVGGSTILFRDVPSSSWFAPYVRDIAQRGIIAGYRNSDGTSRGAYGPADPVTIEQIAKIMFYASGKDASGMTGSVLNLTASGSWSAPFVRSAERFGWSVYADSTVDVHRPARRSEVIVTLLQAYGIAAGERTGDVFRDVTLSTQFGSFIERAAKDGIVAGYMDAEGNATGFFGPDDFVTRAELAKIVSIGMQVYGTPAKNMSVSQ